jgi:hypothetical protein
MLVGFWLTLRNFMTNVLQHVRHRPLLGVRKNMRCVIRKSEWCQSNEIMAHCLFSFFRKRKQYFIASSYSDTVKFIKYIEQAFPSGMKRKSDKWDGLLEFTHSLVRDFKCKILHAYLPEDLLIALKNKATEEKRSLSELATIAIVNYLKSE